MASSVNEKLRDAAINHQIDLTHYSNSVVQKMVAILNATDSDLFAQLVIALQDMTPESFTVSRLEQLLGSVRALNAYAYAQIERELTVELKDFVNYESGYQLRLFKSVIPAQIIAHVDIASVSAEMVYAAAMARPFQGVLLKEALAGLEAGRAKAVRDAIRIGYVQSQTTPQIIKRIRGTKAKNYADGLMEQPRQHIESVVRTALSHTAAFTRDRFFKANSDLIRAISWSSVIDARTSEGCRIRDGLEYTADDAHKPIGHSIPWLGGPGNLHWNCRSIGVPETKSWKDLGGNDIPSFSASTRASMDGQIPAETTYGEWLQKQSAERQDQIVGPTRGKLLRDGGLTMDRFYNDRGVYLNLEEIRARDAAAFAKAGL
jgi:hypothetical protein